MEAFELVRTIFASALVLTGTVLAVGAQDFGEWYAGLRARLLDTLWGAERMREAYPQPDWELNARVWAWSARVLGIGCMVAGTWVKWGMPGPG